MSAHEAPEAAARVREFRSPRLAAAAAIVFLAAVVPYVNSLRTPFVFDDEASIVHNPSILDLGRLGDVLRPPGGMRAVEGRPVVNLSLALNHALGGENVVGYHVFNVAVHALAALVLFGLVRRTLRLAGSEAPGEGGARATTSAEAPATATASAEPAATATATAIAVLWAVHPLQTEAVVGIVQRSETMMALGYLATLYAIARSAASARPWRWQVAAVIACAVGAGCKEVIVTAPIVALLYDRIFLAGSWREVVRCRGRLHAGLFASWFVLALLVASFYEPTGTGGLAQRIGPWEYFLLQPRNVLLYLRLAIWPNPLVLDYGTETPGPLATVLPAALAVAVLLGASVWALRRVPRIGFLGAAFFLILAPTTSILPLASQTTAEKRMYLPLAAVATLAVLGARALGRRLSAGREGAWSRRAPVAALVLIAAALGACTVRRNHDYRSAVAIWADTVAKRPDNARAHYNLGRALALERDVANGLVHLGRSLELAPDDPGTYRVRAYALYAIGRYREAWVDARQVEELGAKMPPEFMATLRRLIEDAPPASP